MDVLLINRFELNECVPTGCAWIPESYFRMLAEVGRKLQVGGKGNSSGLYISELP